MRSPDRVYGRGENTVGRALAKRLHWNFLDLDDLIEQREHMTVAEIFASSGEAAFRRVESAALTALLQDRTAGSDLVLALGGGAFVQKQIVMRLFRRRHHGVSGSSCDECGDAARVNATYAL